MSEDTGSPSGQEAIALPADAPETFDSPSAAAEYYRELRAKPEKQPAESADEPATAEHESAPQEQDSAPETDPAETTKEAEPAEQPPIERPRSWAKDDDDEWNALPRARQEKIAANERARELDIRQRTNDIAEQRKAADAELAKARDFTKALADKLPAMESAVQEYMGRQYPEFKTYDDVVNMARQAEALSETDPFTALRLSNRVQAWREDQTNVSLKLQDARNAAQRLEQERGQNLLKYRAEETEKLKEFVPEISDPVKLKALTGKAIDHLKSFDLSDDVLNGYAAQGEKPFIFSAAFQRILLNSARYEEIQNAPKAVAKPNLPPVQKPGTSKPSGSSVSEREQALTRRLNETGDLAAAQELRQLQMRRA